MFRGVSDVAEFIRAACKAATQTGVGWTVCEFGSLVMHDHDPRPIAAGFGFVGYTGVDWRAGPGVDVVAMNRDAPPVVGDDFALSLSLQALEHDPDWRGTLRAMVAVVRPGGVVAVSVPAPGWPEHETDCAPDGGTYYENRTADEVLDEIRATGRCGEVLKSKIEPSTVPGRSRSLVIVRTT